MRGDTVFSYSLFVTESTVAIQVLQQHSPCHLVLIPDKSQPEQRFTASSTLLIAAPSHPVDDSENFFLLGLTNPDATQRFPHTAVRANECTIIQPG